MGGVSGVGRQVCVVGDPAKCRGFIWSSTTGKLGRIILICVYLSKPVEPPKKGHFGSGGFCPYSEAVLFWEVTLALYYYKSVP